MQDYWITVITAGLELQACKTVLHWTAAVINPAHRSRFTLVAELRLHSGTPRVQTFQIAAVQKTVRTLQTLQS
jgi:hypothetical protein